MFDLFWGLGGLGTIFGLKIKDSFDADKRAQVFQDRDEKCKKFFLKFVDSELESKLIENCRSEDNINKFELACREIGISSRHENITDFHRVAVLLACQNKLPAEWFISWDGIYPDKNWSYRFKGFNFVWNDPDDIYATTKLLCWVNKMIYSNNGYVNILVLDSKVDVYGSGYNYRYLDNCSRKDSVINYGIGYKKYMWDCALHPTDRILTNNY